MSALIKQVTLAAKGDSELNVVTIITKPMWRAFLRACGGTDFEKGATEWLGIGATYRVYGSKTIVVDSRNMASVSMRKK